MAKPNDASDHLTIHRNAAEYGRFRIDAEPATLRHVFAQDLLDDTGATLADARKCF